jgi:SAM-dependent methyltransferase
MEPTDHNLRAWDERYRPQEEAAGLPEWMRGRLPGLAKRHVLHLGCGDGSATAELVQAGALVTGVDPSPAALEAARERLPETALIASEIDELPLQLRRGRFDLVLSGGEFLDPAPWLAGVTTALKGGGELVLHGVHPVARCLDAALRWRGSYFSGELWTVADIVNAVADAGLAVEHLEELPAAQRHRQDPRVPGELLLVARKPA